MQNKQLCRLQKCDILFFSTLVILNFSEQAEYWICHWDRRTVMWCHQHPAAKHESTGAWNDEIDKNILAEGLEFNSIVYVNKS